MKKAFTLVELIVVITILAVLATVAFISFQWYATESRDTVRLTDIKSIQQAFNLNIARDKPLPDGQNMVNITASWANLFQQWTLSQWDLADVGVFNGWFDPVSGSWIVYARNTQKNKFQIWTFMELAKQTTNKLSSMTYADNSKKYFYTKWEKLGILLDKNSDIPVSTHIDIFNVTQEYKAHISNNKIIIWGPWVLAGILPRANCTRLHDNGATKNWIYSIYSSTSSTGLRDVYCDFTYPEYIISDELLQTGDFIEWNEINTKFTSNPTTTILEMPSPIDSWYVAHQTGYGHSEYEVHLLYPDHCFDSKQLTMRVWTSKNIEQSVFHHRAYWVDWSDWYVTDELSPTPTIIDTKIVDGREWNLEQVRADIRDDITNFHWYLGYISIPDSDFYFTWVRLWCE